MSSRSAYRNRLPGTALAPPAPVDLSRMVRAANVDAVTTLADIELEKHNAFSGGFVLGGGVRSSHLLRVRFGP